MPNNWSMDWRSLCRHRLLQVPTSPLNNNFSHQTSFSLLKSIFLLISRDECSVCKGDNSTCLGCDGEVWSHKTIDICNMCGGDNTSCITGCDSLPHSNKTYDSCGVCGGNGDSCAEVAPAPGKKSNMDAIVGGVVGGVGGALLLAGAAVGYFYYRRGKKTKEGYVNRDSSEMTNYSGMNTPAKTNNYSSFAGSGSKFC
jgi:hypothetical protein